MTEIEYVNILDNVRRTAERGLRWAQDGAAFANETTESTAIDLFQHILDELERR